MKRCIMFFLFFSLLVNAGYAETCPEFSLLNAIKLNLQYNNDILLQKENKEISKANIKIAKSKFDTIINPSFSYQHSEIPVTESIQNRSDNVTTGINVTKQFRTGISSNFALTAKRIKTLESSQEAVNMPTVSFSLNIPLLEGLGIEAAAADELAAKNDFITTQYNFLHTVSQSIFQTIVSYWNYLLSVKNLQAYKKSLNRTKKNFNQVKILIEKDERPKADIEQISASLANRRSTVYKGEQDVVSSQNNLAVLIGLSYEDFKLVAYPATEFPAVHCKNLNYLDTQLKQLADEALKRRFDYLALNQAQKTNRINLRAAFDKLKNNLDLSVNVSYQRLKEAQYYGALLDSFWSEKPGLNVNMLLNYKWPVENNYARGIVQKYQSLLKQNIYSRAQLARTIYSNIKIESSNLKKTYNSFLESEKSLSFYKKAMSNEREKYTLGMSTMIDVINMEEKVTNANLNKIAAQYQLAVAIVTLKYEMGKLIKSLPGKNNFNFKLENAVSVADIVKFP